MSRIRFVASALRAGLMTIVLVLGMTAHAVAGSITGTVTSSATGTGASGVIVNVFNGSTGFFVTNATTNASGMYTTSALAAGSYFALTANNQGLLDELYDNLPCVGNCDVTTGTPIVVAAAGATTANFVLAPAFTGTVTNAATGVGVSGVRVQITNSAGLPVADAFTNASGVYWIEISLMAGSYFARTFNSQGLVDELYDNIPCAPNCTITSGTPISVSRGVANTIDFALGAVLGPATISGTVTNASTSTGIAGVTVEAYTAGGAFTASAVTNASGVYSIQPLIVGSYRVRTVNNLGFLDELYDDIPCATVCDIPSGTPVAVTVGATTTVNIALAAGGRIGGTITNASNSAALNGVLVQVYTSTGTSVTTATTDSAGAYTTVSLPAGSYRVRTVNSQSFVDELYNDIPCVPSCNVATGAPVTVTSGATTTVNMALAPGGTISGTVTDSFSGAVAVGVSVLIYSSTGTAVTTAVTNASGVYAVATGLPAGLYRARTLNSAGLIDELYNNIDCPGSCDVTTGAPIAVTALTATTVNFALFPGGRIFGTVTNATTGAGVAGVSVWVYNAAGNFVMSTVTGGAGAYITRGLSQESQYVVRTSNTQSLIDELYNNISCVPQCDVTTGTRISVAAYLATQANFALSPGGSISGTVTNVSTGAGVSNVSVNVFTSSGAFVTNSITDQTGAYTTTGLTAGSYLALTANDQGLIDELYNNIACLGCTITTGTPIAVTAGAPTTANFALTPGGSLSGTVTNATTGAGLSGINVRIYSSGGTFVANTFTNPAGAYTISTGLPAGSYFARTVNAFNQGLRDELYDRLPCRACAVTTGTPISVTVNATHSGINFALLPDLPSVSRADFNGDGKADILWRQNTGAVAIWQMNGNAIAFGGSLGVVDNAWQIVGTGDYNGDGKSDLLWRHVSGDVAIWLMNGTTTLGGGTVAFVDPAWLIAGSGDYNGDGKADLLWRHGVTGAVTIWFMNGASIVSGGAVGGVDPAWQVVASGDFNGDGKSDVLWRHSSGAMSLWLMNGSAILNGIGMGVIDRVWQIIGASDYNGDGKADILWRHGTGAVAVWLMNGGTILGGGSGAADPGWQIFADGDYNGNGKADILWRHSSGSVVMWFMDGGTAVSGGGVGSPDGSWRIIATP